MNIIYIQYIHKNAYVSYEFCLFLAIIQKINFKSLTIT